MKKLIFISLLFSILSLSVSAQKPTKAEKAAQLEQEFQQTRQLMESNHFQSRKTSNNITEYWVVEYSAEERKENSIRPQLPVQTGLEL